MGVATFIGLATFTGLETFIGLETVTDPATKVYYNYWLVQRKKCIARQVARGNPGCPLSRSSYRA